MHSAQVLGQLRSLNWLAQQAAEMKGDVARRLKFEAQANAVRELLPVVILDYHDRMRQRGYPSVAPVVGSKCQICGLELPAASLAELQVPRRFVVCSGCGVLVCSADESEETPTRSEEKGDRAHRD
jgi:predicted  nucleic acid-binding Zn-ribbon protein